MYGLRTASALGSINNFGDLSTDHTAVCMPVQTNTCAVPTIVNILHKNSKQQQKNDDTPVENDGANVEEKVTHKSV